MTASDEKKLSFVKKIEYSNPPIPEEINASTEHPLREFAWLSIGLLTVVIGIVLIIGWLGYILGPLIPFEKEKAIADMVIVSIPENRKNDETAAYLQHLADRLTAAAPLPEGMTITTHLWKSDELNAFAALGGHIFIAQGLLDVLPSENALAMIMAHEIAHVKERHVIRALGRNVLLNMALGILFGSSGTDAASLAGQAGVTAGLSFSRRQEHEADLLALHNLHALYGHVGDATAFFDIAERFDKQMPTEWLSTHPNRKKRIDAIQKQTIQNNWPANEETLDLPERIREGD